MAKLIGAITGKNNGYERSRSSIRRNEDSKWSADLQTELEDVAREEEFFERHARGICKNNDGTYGCDLCYDSSNPVYAEDVDDIEGVTTDMERLDCDE